jgi:hypothetical protein
MMLPAKLTIHDSAYALDGGSTLLHAADEAAREHEVMLVQHALPDPDAALGIPGRLYFDDELVPIRSDLEVRVLGLLRAAEIRPSHSPPDQSERIPLSPNALILGDDLRQVLSRGPEENMRALRAEVIEFIESEEYLRFAVRVEQAADATRSTIGSSSMELTLESGRVIADATEDDIRSSIEGEDFAILAADDLNYMQCAEQTEPPDEYILEYQEGSLDEHYQAVDGPITLDRVIEAFLKYLRGDESWRFDSEWEKMAL